MEWLPTQEASGLRIYVIQRSLGRADSPHGPQHSWTYEWQTFTSHHSLTCYMICTDFDLFILWNKADHLILHIELSICIPRINPTWPRCLTFHILLNLFVRILHLYSTERYWPILLFFVCVISLPGFGTRYGFCRKNWWVLPLHFLE